MNGPLYADDLQKDYLQLNFDNLCSGTYFLRLEEIDEVVKVLKM
ncbi:MAG: hypothetical protein WC389_12435 [Lutibacter sp.]|jgi:hypothetical protein